jgi:hypothetical protein
MVVGVVVVVVVVAVVVVVVVKLQTFGNSSANKSIV